MAHLTLQLGAALVVPFTFQRKGYGHVANVRDRAQREAALSFGPPRVGERGKARPRPSFAGTGFVDDGGRRWAAPLPAAVLATLLLSGCASTIPVPTTVEAAGMPNPEEALRRSMQHVDAEMAQLGQLSPMVERVVAPVVPDDLQRSVSFTWSGPLDKGVAKLALSIGYTFYTSGPPEPAPVAVAVQMSSVPVYQVFQALGDQAGTRATVEVDPLHHQVQVIHHA